MESGGEDERVTVSSIYMLLMEDDVFSVGVASTPGGSVVELLCERPELSKKMIPESLL